MERRILRIVAVIVALAALAGCAQPMVVADVKYDEHKQLMVTRCKLNVHTVVFAWWESLDDCRYERLDPAAVPTETTDDSSK